MTNNYIKNNRIMNKWYFILYLVFTGVCLQAQPPQGGRGMGRGGNRQGSPQGMANRGGMSGQEQLRLDSFPSIPDITLEQRADIGIILAKEQKDIAKHIRKKQECIEKDRQSPNQSEKESEKIRKEIAKTDENIRKRIEKSNKKIRKILSDEQYLVFLEKRNQFKFSRFTVPGDRRPEGNFRERPGGENPGFRR
jgi:hypothetical protein